MTAPREAARRDRLARRYGRLLRWYPADHQARHGGEMLGVLLAAAGPGQERPAARESANLIGGALRIRLRAATTGSAGQWRDALAMAAILLPLAVVTWRLVGDAVNLALLTQRVLVPRPPGPQFPHGLHPDVAGIAWRNILFDARRDGPWLALVIALLAGWRRIARAATAVVAALFIGTLVVSQDYPPYVDAGTATNLSVLLVLALGLTLVTAPPGWSLLRWRHCALTVLAALGLWAANGLGMLSWLVRDVPRQFSDRTDELTVGAVIVVIAGLMLARSPVSRRLLAIVAVPGYFLWIGEFDLVRLFPGVPLYLPGVTSAFILVVWLPLGIAFVATVVLAGRVLARRARDRGGVAAGTPG